MGPGPGGKGIGLGGPYPPRECSGGPRTGTAGIGRPTGFMWTGWAYIRSCGCTYGRFGSIPGSHCNIQLHIIVIVFKHSVRTAQ